MSSITSLVLLRGYCLWSLSHLSLPVLSDWHFLHSSTQSGQASRCFWDGFLWLQAVLLPVVASPTAPLPPAQLPHPLPVAGEWTALTADHLHREHHQEECRAAILLSGALVWSIYCAEGSVDILHSCIVHLLCGVGYMHIANGTHSVISQAESPCKWIELQVVLLPSLTCHHTGLYVFIGFH